MADNLGLYFGEKSIDLVQVRSKKLISSICIPREKFSEGELDEKVPQDIKIVALIKDELRRKKIQADSIGIALSGRDLIIRSFDLPSNLPRDEIMPAVNFEVKKYIPFKIDDLVSTFQIKLYKKEQKNLIVFLSVKVDVLKRYLAIIDQLGLKLKSLEYAAFSILRLPYIINLKKEKGIWAFVNMDLGDEVNFAVFDGSFPLFTREIDLSFLDDADVSTLVEKLKDEVQQSMDYYEHRRFLNDPVKKIYFFGLPGVKDIANKVGESLGITSEFVDLSKEVGANEVNTLGAVKANGVALSNAVKLPFKFDLVAKWKDRLRGISQDAALGGMSLKDVRLSPKVVILSILLVGAFFILGLYNRVPLNTELNRIRNSYRALQPTLRDKSYQDLQSQERFSQKKIKAINQAFGKYSQLTITLDTLPRLLPEGVWLTELRFRQDLGDRRMTLAGLVYLDDRAAEIEAANEFFSNMKIDHHFKSIFKLIDMVSMDRRRIGEREVTYFEISCKY